MRLVVCTPSRLLADVLDAALRPFGHAIAAAARRPDDTAHAAVGTKVAACLLDTHQPPGAPARATAREVRTITAIAPHCAVILLTDLRPPIPIPGVAGTVETTASVARVARALDRLAAGCPLPLSTAPAPAARSRLTPREDAVLRYLGDGHTPEQIALRLGVARSTVRTHIEHVLVKLGAHGTREAVALAHRP